MSDPNHIMNNIKEEIANPEPSHERIITYLNDLRTKEEYQSLSDSEFYDIVGKTFKLNPVFFMKYIYGNRKLYEKVNKKEMEKYIIEKFCLYEGEQILYECNGEIKQWGEKTKLTVGGGNLFVTNHRIIAHGKLSARAGDLVTGILVTDLVIKAFSGGSKKAKSKRKLIETSIYQELPCYGYQFPLKNQVRLKKKKDGVTLWCGLYGDKAVPYVDKIEKIYFLQIKLPRYYQGTKIINYKDQINKLFEVLRMDANQIIDIFGELHEMGLDQTLKEKTFLAILRQLRLSKLTQHLSDSEYLDIVKAVYNFDPEFFMTLIYPKMMSWTFPSFLKVKSELFEILNKEGAKIK